MCTYFMNRDGPILLEDQNIFQKEKFLWSYTIDAYLCALVFLKYQFKSP